MTIDEYAQWVASVSKPRRSRYERLSYSALALIGEAGEVCDNVKNLIRDGTLNEDALVYELGDLIVQTRGEGKAQIKNVAARPQR